MYVIIDLIETMKTDETREYRVSVLLSRRSGEGYRVSVLLSVSGALLIWSTGVCYLGHPRPRSTHIAVNLTRPTLESQDGSHQSIFGMHASHATEPSCVALG